MTFQKTLNSRGISLTRQAATWLQVNVGLVCNLACMHCHHEAGPARTEVMGLETVEAVIGFAKRFSFETIDITGGAPELTPHLPRLITGLAPLAPKLIVRSNLLVLARPESAHLMELYRRSHAAVVASFPSLDPSRTDAVRGTGVYAASVEALRRLNSYGYGMEGSGLELDIAVNPAGAFMSEPQRPAEERFRTELFSRHGIHFNNLFTFANVPLGRFRSWLEGSGELSGYAAKLREHFTPCTISGLMCRSLISVNWEGHLYDCDFNLAAKLPYGGFRRHISSLEELPRRGEPIAVGDHCFTCTAGAGFTCCGSISP